MLSFCFTTNLKFLDRMQPMEKAPRRFDLKPVHAHLYMVFVYVLGALLAIDCAPKPVVILLLFGFGLCFLSTFWNIKILILQCYTESPSGMFILCEDKLSCVTKELGTEVESFMCDRQKHVIEDKKIRVLEPSLNYTFSQFREGILVHDYDLYPPNEFKVPSPSFVSLFKEQCVTPLFCFQIFSSLLMCFDDHVMSSLFSTAIMIFVEASMVLSRVTTMKVFRRLEHRTSKIQRISRGNARGIVNEMVDSSLLKPGDRIVIDSAIDVPCDLLILDGSCAVNEAMLSGESVPLLKEEAPATDERLSLKDNRKHILFAGTKLEKITTSLTCYVLRTGFCTEQGSLLNKMLKSEDIKYDREALRFILLLTIISLANSICTLRYSSKKGYALFLDVIILFTNSIPFELPMEMGMSIQSAVKNLMAKKIYCLEPFRITLAGKVNVCCFDKTGTLTDSRLEIKKIEYPSACTNKVLSCCHSLIPVGDEMKGDPLDLAIHNYPFEKHSFGVLKQFPFASELKRQSVVAEMDGKLVFCMKGAPEQIQKYLKSTPEEYDNYKSFAKHGYRIIALAYRDLNINDVKLSEDRISDRGYLEREMVFCGFLLLGCSLKEYAVEMCSILKQSGIKVLMITGDNILTAMSVAKQLNISGRAVEGNDIERVLEEKDFPKYTVFGRADPKHKEMIIKKYQALGHHTMMVGDGTNDVGALKAADVGVAMLETQDALASKGPIKYPLQMGAEYMGSESIKPGDASIAAPFTIKNKSLASVVEIIQQGRSSLVTTIQMYKILALNSITNGFFLMMVDIIGIKFSDAQMISIGVLSSIGFSAITRPKTLPTISRERPLSSIFNMYVFSSIISQSAIQIGSLYMIHKYVPAPKPGTSFEPSVMNTVLFVISSVQTISMFICNYIGRPFRENLFENNVLFLSLLGIVGFIANILFRIHQDLNDMIRVVDISQHVPFVIGISVSIVALCFTCERICLRLFMIK